MVDAVLKWVLAEVGRKGGADGGEGGIDYAAAVGLVDGRWDGTVDCEADCAPAGDAGGARHHVERAVDGDGDNWEMEFHGELVGSFMECAHFACECARAFGEHHHRHSVAECALGFLHGASDGCGR